MSAFGRDPQPKEAGPTEAAAPSGPTPWDVMQRQLRADETLIWADRPVDLFAHAKRMAVQSIFGIPFLAFAIFWTRSAASMSSEVRGDGIGDTIGSVFPLFGWAFILVGAGLVLSPVYAALRARRAIYGATDQRLIIRNELPRTSVRSFPLDGLEPLERAGPEEGTGTLYFARDISSNNNSRGVTVSKVGFVGISEPMRLEQTIEELRQAAKENQASPEP